MAQIAAAGIRAVKRLCLVCVINFKSLQTGEKEMRNTLENLIVNILLH